MKTLACALAMLAACGDDGAKPGGDGGGCPSQALCDPDGPDLLNTPANQWTWVEIPGTTCGNGTPAGFGLNRIDGAQKLFVYFEGGGACWDAATCFTQHTAVNIDVTYDAAKFAADIGTGPVDRSPSNPFADATLVWIPYCTGDLHAGARVADYGAAGTVHHTGWTNTAAFVSRLHAKYPAASTVWIAGSSAGGYGGTLTFGQFTDAWSEAGVHLLQDSSPFVPVLQAYPVWTSAWDLQGVPADAVGDGAKFPTVIDALAAGHPASRVGLLTYDDDAVVKQYFGYTGSMVPATQSLAAHQYAHPNTKVFELAGTSHTMLGGIGTIVSPSGVSLATWVEQWAVGDPAWASVTP